MKENDIVIKVGRMNLNKMLYATEVYLLKEKENTIAYFRKASSPGYDVLKMDTVTLNIIKQEGSFGEKEIELCREYISTSENVEILKGILEERQDLISKTLEDQINNFDKIHNYEYIDKYNNKHKLLNNLRYENNIFMVYDYHNIIGDFNIKFDENEFNIKNAIAVNIYDEFGSKVNNTKRVDRKRESNILDIDELRKCVIHIWEVKESYNIDSPKINIYNVHILYDGKEQDILEDVITDSMPPFLLDVSSGVRFGYKRKLDDNTFEYLRYNNGKEKSKRISNNRYFSDEALQYINKAIKDEDLDSSFSASVTIELPKE